MGVRTQLTTNRPFGAARWPVRAGESSQQAAGTQGHTPTTATPSRLFSNALWRAGSNCTHMIHLRYG